MFGLFYGLVVAVGGKGIFGQKFNSKLFGATLLLWVALANESIVEGTKVGI